MGRHTKPKSQITYLGGRPAEVIDPKTGKSRGCCFSPGARAVSRQEDRALIDAIRTPVGAVRSATHAKTFKKRGSKGQNGNHHHYSGQSLDINAAFQAPRRGHGTIELSKKGSHTPSFRKSKLPSKQSKQITDYSKPKPAAEPKEG